ncbi:GNAT family N-acetyltransferase [Thermosipho ferrireducens]|uniref:GNAT family N-acetyltransferase n=1 Tax=Thermosipho ferrireducens TaxID=2571116 RepID=A0ABX7S8C6_9BACT|nr:GNAT family protein [Thermosipho ferrireducens]QTA38091.1 GNAT family N-acetyltransferase [Thermosipho ferrireducens]
MRLEGKKIVLRPLEIEDAKRIVDIINDEEVREYLFITFPISRFSEEDWIRKNALSQQNITFAIDVEDILVGVTGLMNINWVHRSAEFGIGIFDKRYWNKGFGTEATKLMLKYTFEYLNLNRLCLRVFDNNKRAIRVYEKCGFIHEGRERQARYFKGKYWDILRMSILAEEYWRTKENQNG